MRWRPASCTIPRLTISLSAKDHHAFVSALETGGDRDELVVIARAWTRAPTIDALAEIERQSTRIAKRMAKELKVVIEDNGLRWPIVDIQRFISSLVHVLRNAIDHGLESPEVRSAAGKPVVGTLRVSTSTQGGGADSEHLVLAISDDGRGIDWDAIAERARGLGLPASDREQLVRVLFHDGLSTRDQVSELSGRGVGLSATDEVCRECGIEIEVSSTVGQGTEFRFRFPSQESASPRKLAA